MKPRSLDRWLLIGLLALLAWAFHRQLGVVPIYIVAVSLAWPMRFLPEGKAALWTLGILGATWILHELRWVVYPLLGGILLTVWLEPSVEAWRRKRVPRPVAAALALLPLGLAGILAALVLVPTVAHEIEILIEKAPAALAVIRGWATPLLERVDPNLLDPAAPASGVLSEIPRQVLSYLEKVFKPALAGAADLGRGLGKAAQVAGAVFLAPLLAYYLLLDWPSIRSAGAALVPLRHQPGVERYGRECERVFRTYMRGQILLAGIEAVLYSVGFLFAGLDAAIAVGILAGFFSLVPVVGFWITLLVAALSALIGSDPMGGLVGVAIVIGVVQAIEGQLLVPRIQGSGLGLHSMVVLLGVLALGVLFGVPGALLAVPVLAMLKLVWTDVRAVYRRSRFYRGDDETRSAT